MSSDLIVKKIVYAGTKPATFQDGTKVHFHFQTRLCDKDGTVVDDSREIGKGEPLELVLGKKFKLEVWEAIIQKMALNEVAKFTVDKSLVLQYPFVSKTIRDAQKPRENRKAHCCSMTLQSEGLGYDDLNAMMKHPSDLEFTIDLVKVEQPDDYKKDYWQMDDDEKVSQIPALKEQGNTEFKNKNYKTAADHYAQAIGMLEHLMSREKPHDIEWNKLNAQKNVLLLNYAQCKLFEKEYYTVIEHCTTVLNSEPDNMKALFRRGKAHAAAWNVQLAKEDFERVAQLDPSLTATVKRELAILDNVLKEKIVEDREKLKQLFK